MKTYELTYLISPSLLAEEIITLQNRISLNIQEKGGVLINSFPIIKKQLASPIRKKSSAFMATIVFQVAPEEITKIGNGVKAEENVLRHLLLNKIPPKKVKLKRKPLTGFKPTEDKEESVEKPLERTKEKQKLELSDIDEKLDEILK
ncbi:MAG: hypothetical protein COZ91_01890 [Candidatus Nealsonbacteria bacterium CG_4_8_14_3_um_filter_39_7]|uniref:Small ribosomal subunit protein bS6 n=1 Tax=Candidatus Nealsonbacteria bacterium CG23_combo_of_CG06-09_8_20_14_all_39_17 TaxID=1974722 RepID=A0A2G9YUE5_9BACT|nr:MAG: hypothetical protein COX37_01810 [Candidatus Nealsonbacteria bacterium CG23_combo_of_CG06-09_8_20_14_all_39_17]PIU44126.1 MAG: hypothetical protein COS96_00590 [Candidatus Nealsonbacteria bacterium CG07_land_8_20_14_0_80_39_13]PIW91176.1 MAG: hypothetical protein COZ91_01890 [Candidatus Nealsonbacteria bacterium CG_4_8_14_3_um_filter_39_7]